MEPFLILRCAPARRKKLVYFAIGLDCPVPVLEALFYFAFGTYSWDGTFRQFVFKLKLHIGNKLTDILKVESSPPANIIDSVYSKYWEGTGVEMIWNYGDYQTECEIFNTDGHKTKQMVSLMSRVERLMITFDICKNELCIVTRPADNIRSVASNFPFGRFDEMIDAHLKSLLQ